MPVLPSYRNQSIDLLANQLTSLYMRATLAFKGLITVTAYLPYHCISHLSFILQTHLTAKNFEDAQAI